MNVQEESLLHFLSWLRLNQLYIQNRKTCILKTGYQREQSAFRGFTKSPKQIIVSLHCLLVYKLVLID